MNLFDPTKGPVTIRSVDKGTSFEVFQALQAEQPVGSYRLDWMREGVAMQTVIGHGHAAYGAPFVRQSDIVLGYKGRITYFSDFWEAATYDSALRISQSDWVNKNRAKYDAAHILLNSKLFSMAAAVVNLAVGGWLKSYTNRAEFEKLVVKQGLPAKRPMPR
jgi:hypothetical protein